MSLIELVGSHEVGLVAAIVELGKVDGAVKNEAGLRDLIVGAGSTLGDVLPSIGVEVGVLEDVISGTMEVVSAGANDCVGDSAVAVADLGVEDGGLNFDLLDGLGGGNKAGVIGLREALGWIVGDAVEGQAVVTAAVAVGGDLDGDSAEGVGELTGLALEVAAGAGVQHARGECGHHKGIATVVRQVGHLFGAKRSGDVGGACV